MQEVLGNTSKVMLDVEGGNNLTYLPLDKIMDSTRDSISTRQKYDPQATVPNTVTPDARDVRSRRTR